MTTNAVGVHKRHDGLFELAAQFVAVCPATEEGRQDDNSTEQQGQLGLLQTSTLISGAPRSK